MRNTALTFATFVCLFFAAACSTTETARVDEAPAPLARSSIMDTLRAPGPSTSEIEHRLDQPETRARFAQAVAPEEIPIPEWPIARRASLPEMVAQRDIDVTLNFKGAPAVEVFREIFERVLQVDYMIGPTVTGEMSFMLEGRISSEELLRTLDAVSSAYGWALQVREGMVYVVDEKTIAKAPGRVQVAWDRVRPDVATNTYVIPLTNAGASEIVEAVRQLLTPRGVVFTAPRTNVLVLVDSPANVDRIMAVLAELDRPFFAGRTLRLYTPRFIPPGDLATGLREYAQASGVRTTATQAEQVQFSANVLPRSGQLLVMTTVRDLVPMLDGWFDRLDQPVEVDKAQMHVYRAQHLSPESLQGAIDSMFGYLDDGDRPEIAIISESRVIAIRAKPAVYRQVRDMIRLLDGPPKQVYLQVVVAEVVISGDVQFGVELFTNQSVGDYQYELRSDANLLNLDPVGSAFVLGKNAFALIQAARLQGTVRVLSAPYAVATSGKPAMLNVGREVPTITRTIGGTTDAVDPNRIDSSIEYRETGVILNVTPTVNDRGSVVLDITQEVSDVEEPSPGASIQSPSFPKRELSTTVMINSGDTAVLGGIRIERESDQRTGIPVLSDIPLIGLAFSGKNVRREQTELVILVTPTIVLDPSDLPYYASQFLGGVVNIDRIDSLISETKVDTNEMFFRK
ncbi:MAG: hypothetical protein EA379_10465 [Phycisphaerales bacterium]|nr:MAG: hypothetical protein EA379_10465 [Phycisphaerales bacterium]